MGPFGLPWSIAGLYLLATVGLLITAEIFLHSKKWKDLSAFYFAWNEQEEDK